MDEKKGKAELQGQAKAAAYRLILANVPIGTLLRAQIERWATRAGLESSAVDAALTDVRTEMMDTISSLQKSSGRHETTIRLANPDRRDGTGR